MSGPRNENGRVAWKDAKGRTLAEIRAAEVISE